MIKGRAIVSLCMLCALLVSAVAAQGASAATKGTTGTAPAGSGYTGNIPGEAGNTLLHSVISGVLVELRSTSLTGTGTATSMVEGSEHTSSGTGAIEYHGVTVVKPEGRGCIVKTGEVKTNELKATTAGQGMFLKFEPATGSTFAKFEIEGCAGSKALEGLNGVYEVTGSVKGVPTEGTNETVFTAAATTAQGTLKLRGQTAGIDGTLKLRTESGEAIKFSTVETLGTTGTTPAGSGYTGNITGEAGEAGNTLLHSVISGVLVELRSTSLTGTGTATSMLAENSEGTIVKGEHTSSGTGAIEYHGVTVVKPEGRGCKVKTGEVKTNELAATTAGQGMFLKVEPAAGSTFAKFEIEGCAGSKALEALNGVYELTGSVKGVPTEGTNETVFTAAATTAQGTLKLRGQTAGIDGTLKLRTESGEAIKFSTVETP